MNYLKGGVLLRKAIITIYIFIFLAAISRMTIDSFTSSKPSGIFSNGPSSSVAVLPKAYDIFIDIVDNTLAVFEDGILLKEYPVASGRFEYPSPAGIWKIVSKSDWGEGFGGSWMKLDVPWGTYGIHGTASPWSIGSDASHGCIRMHSSDAEELYNLVPIGTVVVISKGPYSPIGKNPRVMIPGDRGSDVLRVQTNLKKLKFYTGPLDGVYGESMKKSLFKFQESLGCSPHNEVTTWDLRMMGIFPFE